MKANGENCEKIKTVSIIVETELRWKDVVGDITEDEYNAVVKEISERIRDIVFMNLEHKVYHKLKDVLEGNPFINDPISFECKVTFVVSDLIQIIGRIRRGQRK